MSLRTARRVFHRALEVEDEGQTNVLEITTRDAQQLARYTASGVILRELLREIVARGALREDHRFFIDVVGACAVYDDELSEPMPSGLLQGIENPQLSTSTPSTTSGLLSDSGEGEDRIS